MYEENTKNFWGILIVVRDLGQKYLRELPCKARNAQESKCEWWRLTNDHLVKEEEEDGDR